MNSLRKSSKSLKRFINTKAKDHGLKITTGKGRNGKKDSSAAETAQAPYDETPPKLPTEDKKSLATQKVETVPAEPSAAEPNSKKTTAVSSPAAAATTTNRSSPASKTANATNEQPFVAKKKTTVRRKATDHKATNAEASAKGTATVATKRSPKEQQSTAQSTTKPRSAQLTPTAGQTVVSSKAKTPQQVRVPAKQTLEEASTKSNATNSSLASKQSKALKSTQSKASSDAHETASVQSKTSLVQQRAAAMERPSSSNDSKSNDAASRSTAMKPPQATQSAQSKESNAVNDTTSLKSRVSLVKQRAVALQQSFESVQSDVATKASAKSSEKADNREQDENGSSESTNPDAKPKVPSASSITSVTASVQSSTSRGSPVAKTNGATAAVPPPQRSYSSSLVSLNRSGSGLPPRAAKLKPTLRPLDHDETSTIATTFTTPISYVEFSAEDESKLHLPNDACFDSTTKLLMCDLQSSEAEIVLKSMEALRTTDAKVLVSLQSALPILIAMRRWLKDANIQIAGLQILDSIASDHLEFCQTAVTYGALQICLAALQNHPRHSLVQKHACGALVQLVVADAHTFVLKLGGVEIVTQTAVPHAPKFVVFLLQYLSYWQDDFKARLVRDGGLQALAEIVEGSSGNLHKAAKSTMQRLL